MSSAIVLACLVVNAHLESAGAQLPSLREAVSVVCDTIASGTLTGDVRHLDGSPMQHGLVLIFWNDIAITPGTSRVARTAMRLTAPVSSSGAYRACNVPLATTLLISFQPPDSSRSNTLRAEIDDPKTLFFDITVGDGSKRTVSGVVSRANGQPIAAAQVRVVSTDLSAVTNERGEFRIANVPAGTQSADVTALGYDVRHMQMDVGGSGATINVEMDRKAVLLDSVRTVAAANRVEQMLYRAFENRRQNGIGYFITEKQIADMHVISTDEILRRVPSVRVLVKHTLAGDSVMVVSRRGRVSLEVGNDEKPVCTLDVFIDGRRSDVSDIQLMEPSAIHGMEVHSVATMPVEYHASQCGAVLIWTR